MAHSAGAWALANKKLLQGVAATYGSQPDPGQDYLYDGKERLPSSKIGSATY